VEVDCIGICWGPNQKDPSGTCCLPSQLDCLGYCNTTNGPTHIFDKNGVCCAKTSIDICGICNGNGNCCIPPCGEFGKCITSAFPAFCNCSGGYFGPTCNSFNCTRPCKNGGECAAPDQCNCLGTGFLGVTCAGVPCNGTVAYCDNGGTCNYATGTCNCATANGYYGPECASFNCTPPCQHTGTCVGLNICSCIASGFNGPLCSVPYCVAPCQNGGTWSEQMHVIVLKPHILVQLVQSQTVKFKEIHSLQIYSSS